MTDSVLGCRVCIHRWEIFISFRKLALVIATKFADGQRLPCSLINLFVAVAAFGCQVYTLPFANNDANIAEALTLLATILILVLGLAQKAKSAEELIGGISEDEDALMGTFLGNLNIVIYVLMGLMVGASIMIVFRRLRGALFNAQHLTQLDNAENDGRQIPDEVRAMLHKRWLLVASSWAAIKAKEAKEDGELQEHDLVRLTNGDLAHVKECHPGNRVGRYVVELAPRTATEDMDEQRHALDDEMQEIQDTIRRRRYEIEVEQREVERENLMKEGDIERMTRVFTKFGKQQQSELVTKWQGLFPHWDDFFPEKDRRSMYILGACAELGDLEDLVWVMEQLIDMETEQHNFCPKCCSKLQATRIWNADWRSYERMANPPNDHRILLQAQRGAQDDTASTPRAAAGSHTNNPSRFRQSRAERESTLRTTLLRLQAEQERNRAGWRCAAGGRSCAPLAEVLWGTQQRAAGAVVTTLLSVFVTVLCVTRILVSQFAGTGDGSDKTLCHANEGGRFAGYLVAYWILLLVVLIGLLWRDLRSKELKRLSRQSRRMEERESGREGDRSRPETIFDARGLRPDRTSAGRADDGYSSGGEDDPNWRGR
jgi:hypothetical protein